MKRVLDFAYPLLASLSLLISCPSLDAQLSKGLEQCLPYPTLAQELQGMRDETQKPVTDQVGNAPVRIVAIAFVGGNNLSPALRNSLRRLILRHRHYDDPELDWLREIQEVDVRGFLQDSGYFQTGATLEAQQVTKERRAHDYSLTLYVESGSQFRLGAVQFASADPDKDLSVPQDELRHLLTLNQGDLFRTNKIRAAMESIIRFYGSNGFVDCVPMPITAVDKDTKTIDLSFNIDEGLQYRVGKVEIVGVSESLKSTLKLAPQPGQVFNQSQIQEFLSRNKALLPAGVDERSVEVSRDTRARIVNLKSDFWSYPSCAGLTAAEMPVPQPPVIQIQELNQE